MRSQKLFQSKRTLDAELLLAGDAEKILRQVLTVSPGVQQFIKGLTRKHLNR